jgi:hypothetical protein
MSDNNISKVNDGIKLSDASDSNKIIELKKNTLRGKMNTIAVDYRQKISDD